jgi:hypothetical protein
VSENHEEQGWKERVLRPPWWIVGPLGLIAWFATLWFMFGDVL